MNTGLWLCVQTIRTLPMITIIIEIGGRKLSVGRSHSYPTILYSRFSLSRSFSTILHCAPSPGIQVCTPARFSPIFFLNPFPLLHFWISGDASRESIVVFCLVFAAIHRELNHMEELLVIRNRISVCPGNDNRIIRKGTTAERTENHGIDSI